MSVLPALNSRGDPVETLELGVEMYEYTTLPSIPGATRLKHVHSASFVSFSPALNSRGDPVETLAGDGLWARADTCPQFPGRPG